MSFERESIINYDTQIFDKKLWGNITIANYQDNSLPRLPTTRGFQYDIMDIMKTLPSLTLLQTFSSPSGVTGGIISSSMHSPTL